jgi:hypothetical protein
MKRGSLSKTNSLSQCRVIRTMSPSITYLSSYTVCPYFIREMAIFKCIRRMRKIHTGNKGNVKSRISSQSKKISRFSRISKIIINHCHGSSLLSSCSSHSWSLSAWTCYVHKCVQYPCLPSTCYVNNKGYGKISQQ